MAGLRRPLDRRAGWALVAIGALLAFGLQYAIPVGVPLYDGVVVQEPYRFLHPASDQAGDPGRGEDTKPITGDKSPAIAVNTGEQPPQAQLIALDGAFRLSQGASQLHIVIEPVEPPIAPTTGAIAGNAYRFAVTDQSGTAVPIQSCEGCISLVMRSPDGIGSATLMRFDGAAWTAIETIHAGTVALYQTNPTALGTIAVVTTSGGSGNGGAGTIDPIILVLGGAVVVLFLAVMGLLVMRRRDPGGNPEPMGPAGNRIPSKRKRSNRPPSGRSDS